MATLLRLLAIGLACLGSLTSVVAQDNPFEANVKDPGKDKAGWGGMSIPIKSGDEPTFGPRGCPVVLVENKVHEIATGKELCALETPRIINRISAVSANGKFAAIGSSISNDTNQIFVFDAQTGAKVMEIPQISSSRNFLYISLNRYLISNTTDQNSLDVWDLETKAKKKPIVLGEKRIDWKNVSFSGDGKNFCMIGDDGPVVCDTSTGKVVARLPLSLDAPAVAKNRGLPSPAKNPDAFRAALKAKMSASFSSAWMQTLSFSPDNDEIAGLTSHPNYRLLVWSRQGKLIHDLTIPDSARGFNHSIAWLPEKTGWIVNRLIVDRTSKRAVMQFAADARCVATSKDQLLGTFGAAATQIEQFTIPWADLQKSVKAMNAKTPAILAPYQPVSIEVRVDKARGDVAELTRLVTEALMKRLDRDGVTVKAGQPTTFRITVSEQAGEQLPIYSKTSPFDFRGRDTGAKATEAKGTAFIEIFTKDEAEPLWRDVLQSSNSTSFKTDVNDATVRESMLENLSLQLNRLNLPYFIPKAEDMLALPALVQ